MPEDHHNTLFSILLAGIEPYGVYLHENPYDVALILKDGLVVEKISTTSDVFDIESEIAHSVEFNDANEIYKAMPFSEEMLNKLGKKGIESICIGLKSNEETLQCVSNLDFEYMDGFVDEEISRINRFWIKKRDTGSPYVIQLFVMGLDGKAIKSGSGSSEFEELGEILEILTRSGKIFNLDKIPVVFDSLEKVDKNLDFPIFNSVSKTSNEDTLENLISGVYSSNSEHVDSVNSIIWCDDIGEECAMSNADLVDEVVSIVVPCLNGSYDHRFRKRGIETGYIRGSWLVNVRR